MNLPLRINSESMQQMLKVDYETVKEATITGRYITPMDIDAYLDLLIGEFDVGTVGKSVQGRHIRSITLGAGSIRIMMWSQMHGNESTTTKSVLDLINYLRKGSDSAKSILKYCTLCIIPILNPDGAIAYTRLNANAVDLNRDAQERTQPESIALWKIYHLFKPDFCFNLHDQRTIFNVGTSSKPATVSFLAPAHDPERSISSGRAISMHLIVAMNEELQKYIPGQIGRFDDSFNSNCIGDALQMLQTPTVLLEAGHFQDDYEREKTRYYIFLALLKGVTAISQKQLDSYSLRPYFDIPENSKMFYDVLIRNIDRLDSGWEVGDSAGIHFVETLVNGKIDFVGKLEQIGNLEHMYGHETYNCLDTKHLEKIKSNPNLLNALK